VPLAYWCRNKEVGGDEAEVVDFIKTDGKIFDNVRTRYGAISMRVGATNRAVNLSLTPLMPTLSGNIWSC